MEIRNIFERWGYYIKGFRNRIWYNIINGTSVTSVLSKIFQIRKVYVYFWDWLHINVFNNVFTKPT